MVYIHTINNIEYIIYYESRVYHRNGFDTIYRIVNEYDILIEY